MPSIIELLKDTHIFVAAFNILFVIFIILGAIIGLIRGRRKAVYWFVVTLIIVVGSWIVFPSIFKALCEVNWLSYGINVEIPITEGEAVPLTSITETLKVIVEKLVELEEGQDVTTTQTFALALALVEMVVRVVFILTVLILNWTLFKIIFLIVYLFIRPKKKDEYGVKRKPSWLNRLTGMGIGLLNAIFIYFILSVPFAGLFSIAENAAEFAQYAKTEQSEDAPEDMSMVRIAYQGEILKLDSEGGEILDYFLDNATDYAHIYRNSVAGTLFSIKIGGTELDNKAFDGLISVNVDGKKVSFRKEILAVSKAASVLLGKIGKPLVENDFKFTPDLLQYIDGEMITDAFNELSNLQVIDMVVPVGIELLPSIVKSDNSINAYISMGDLAKQVKDVNFGETLAEIGEFSGNLFNLFFDKEFTIKDILDEENKIDKNKVIDRVFAIDEEKIDTLFDSLAGINIIDALNESVVYAGSKILKEKTGSLLLLKPVFTINDDGYVIIDGVLSNYLAPKSLVEHEDSPATLEYDDVDTYTCELDENGFWVINDFTTNVNGLENSFEISLEGLKLTDEIKNIAPIFKSLIAMDLKSLTDLSKQLENKELTISTEKFTYENVDRLFDALFSLKVISNNKKNIEVIVKNMIPNDFRAAIKLADIEANDLSSVFMAAKVLYDSGVVNAILKEGNIEENIDLELVVKDYGDAFIDELLSSKLIGENITPVLSAVITMTLGKDVFVVPDIDWNNEGKTELKSVLDVLATALKFKSKFSDFKSLTADDITEILDKIKDNLAGSEIIKQNMNNLIRFLNEQAILKDNGIVLKTLDNDEDWTEEEIANLIEGVKIIIVTIKDDETESGINIYKIFNLTDEEIEEIVKSEFTRKTVISTLYKFIRDNESLSEKIVLNIEEDDPKWDGEHGELEYFLKALVRLFKGIEDFENEDLTKKIIINLASLSNDMSNPKDDVSYILGSTVLVDSFAKIITDLANESNDLIIVEEPIEWRDYTSNNTLKPGEIRSLIKAINILSKSKGSEYLVNTLTGGETKDIVDIFLDTNDSEVEEILASKIFTDTLKKFIIKYSKPDEEEDRKAYIYLKDENMPTDKWRSELLDIIKAARILLVEEVDDPDNPGQKKKQVNLDKFTKGDTAETLDMLANIKDEDIAIVTKSEILVDSIAKIVNDLTVDSDDIKISDEYKSEGKTWDDAFTALWKAEIERLIKATKAIVFDKDGNSLAKNITSGDNNDLLELLLNLKDDDEKISKVLDSDIFYETIKHQINKLAEEKDGEESVISMPTGEDAIDNWTRDYWKSELKSMIYAIDKLLTEEVDDPDNPGTKIRKANINRLSSEDADSLLQLIVDLTDEELDKVLESKIITSTISTQIKKLGDDDGDRLINTDSTVDFTLSDWRVEIKKIIKSLELLVVEDGKVNTQKLKDSNTDEILQMIADLKDGTDPDTGLYDESKDEIKVVLQSIVIVDTISEKIIDMSEEENAVVTVKDDIRGTENVPGLNQDEWRVEIRAIIRSVNILLTDEEGKVSTEKLNSGKTDDLLQLICDLNDDDIDTVLKSMIITDTISTKIVELGEEKDGEKPIITIKTDVKNHDSDLDYGRAYWRSEINKIIKSAKLLLQDKETGKVSTEKLNSGKTDDLLDLICGLKDDEINKVVESEVIVDTISVKIIELGDQNGEEKPVLTIKADIKAHDNDEDYGRAYWRSEVAKIIKSAKTLLMDDETGKVSTEKLNSGKTDDLLELICDLEDSEISTVLESEVIVDTISVKIVELGDQNGEEKPVLTIKADVKAHDNDADFGRSYWRSEVAKIIKSAKLMLQDEETGKVSTEKLNSGKTDDLLELICDLEDDEVSKVVESEVIIDTISVKIIELGDQNGEEKPVLTIKADIKAHDNDADYGRSYWRSEVAKIIKSAKLMLQDEETGKVSTEKLNSGKTDDLLQLICDLEDNEVSKVVESDVIVDTISVKIIELGDKNGEEKPVLTIKADIKAHDNDTDFGRGYWRVEVEKIIKSVKLMLTDEEGKVDSSVLNSGDTNKILKLISDLDNGIDEFDQYNPDNDEIQKVVASDVICDTIAQKIIDLGCDDEGNIDNTKTVNVTNVIGYSREEWRGEGRDGGEIKKIIRATNILLREEVDDPNNPGQKIEQVNINKITDSNDNELVELICNMTDEEADEVVKSTLITDTISKQIKTFDNTLTISDEVKAYDTDMWRVEIVALVKSSRLVVAEKDVNGKYIVDMEKVRGDSNFVVNNIVNLKNEPNSPEDEFGTAIDSVIIRDTIITKIKDQSKEKGGMLVISENTVWADTFEGNTITKTGELRRIFKSLKLIFQEEDPMNPGNMIVNIDLAKLSANDVLTRTKKLDSKPGEDGDEIGEVLESKIISDTIIDSTVAESEKPGATIVVRYDRDSDAWYDTYNSNGTFIAAGELRKLLVDLKYLFKNEAEINMNEFKVDNMIDLDDDELVEVFNSIIILDTFYAEIDKQVAKPGAVLQIKEGTVKDSDEAVRFVKAIRIVRGDKTITTLDSSQFNLDEFINNKTDAELDILFASDIIRYSASLKVHDVMTGTGSLSQYIDLDKDYNDVAITGEASAIKDKQLEMIEDDIVNLVKVIRDLKSECGIDYNNGFTFEKFEAAAKPDPSEPDSTENADRISDILANSQLIVHSLPKMIHQMLSGSLSASQLESINTNMKTETRNYWLNYDINGNGTIDNVTIDPDNNIDDENGELRKIIRILTNIDSFAKDTGDVFSSKTDKNEITKPLLLINNSLVLRGLIPGFSETALSNISDWLYSPRTELTKVMWDSEIDNLGDIIIQINAGGLGNLSSLDVKTVNTTELNKLLKLVNNSRIIDISHIEGKVETAVNNTFDTDVTVNKVYTGSNYDEKVAAWNAEIDKLTVALDSLQLITDTSITGANGVENAGKIGQFLDDCRETTMLHNIVSDVCSSVLTKNGVSPAILAIAGIDLDNITSYKTTLEQIAGLL